MRLLLDQGLPRSTAQILKAKGWDVVHVGEVGMGKTNDRSILEYAAREHRICVTLDADFHAILALAGSAGPSVIRIRREGLDGERLARLLVTIWPKIGEQVARGALVTVTEHALRVRHPPI